MKGKGYQGVMRVDGEWLTSPYLSVIHSVEANSREDGVQPETLSDTGGMREEEKRRHSRGRGEGTSEE